MAIVSWLRWFVSGLFVKQRWDRSYSAATQQLLRRRGRSESFEVYGFDFLIGEDLKPWCPGLEPVSMAIAEKRVIGMSWGFPERWIQVMDFNKNLETPVCITNNINSNLCYTMLLYYISAVFRAQICSNNLSKLGFSAGNDQLETGTALFVS